MYDYATLNIANFSEFLEQVNSGRMRLEGYYRGRKVVLSYFTMGSRSNNFIAPCIEPLVEPKQKFFRLTNPRITENTVLVGKKIYYNCRRGLADLWSADRWGNIKVFSKDEIPAVLEELVQAAEIVESNPEL